MRSHPTKPPMTNPPPARSDTYWLQAQRPLHCLVFIAPLLAAFEITVAVGGSDLVARHLLQRFLTQFGAPATHLPAVLLIVVLILWHILSHARWRVELYVLVGMAAEAMLLATPLLGVALLGQRLFPALAGAEGVAATPVVEQLFIWVGGGIYEEFLFRMIGLNLLGLLLIDVLSCPKDLGHAIAVVLTAGAFALYHFPGSEIIDGRRFVVLFVAGCYLGGVYLLRGFGIAVGAHAFFNMMVLWLKIDPLA